MLSCTCWADSVSASTDSSSSSCVQSITRENALKAESKGEARERAHGREGERELNFP